MSWSCQTCDDSHPGRFSYCPVSGEPQPREHVPSKYYYVTFHYRVASTTSGSHFYGELVHRHPLVHVADMRRQEEGHRAESLRRLVAMRSGGRAMPEGAYMSESAALGVQILVPDVLFWSEMTVREAIVAAKALGMPGLPSDEGLIAFDKITEAPDGP